LGDLRETFGKPLSGGEVEFRLLGEVEVTEGGQVIEVGHARQLHVLAVLLLCANQVVRADVLIERVWGERLPSRPRDTLYGYLSRLHSVLSGAALVQRKRGGYLLSVDPMSVDAHRFAHLVSRARAAAEVSLFTEALGLWRGEALAGLDSPWVRQVREQLTGQRFAAELDRDDLRLRDGQHDAVVAELSTRVSAGSVDERQAGQLMLGLYRSGRPADALRAFEQVRGRLADELGVDPGPALRSLQQRILTADPTLDIEAGTGSVVPRQLPASPRYFIGRDRELTALHRVDAPIVAITGVGGVGKTWLALRWAQANIDRFPGGQLFIDLRGFDPSGEPVSAETAVQGLLGALGVASSTIPAELTAQAALYRSLLVNRRMLIVLDNARDTASMSPLLPGGGCCVVLVTSRNRLTGLVSAHGAHALPVSLLSDREAHELLSARIGQSRMDAEPVAAEAIVRACAGLPLALGIAAARCTTEPGVALRRLATELASGRLDALDSEDLPASVRAVFSASYNALDADTARAFRLLGLAPGADISQPAATHLTTQPPSVLRRLATANLIHEHQPGRYRMHDLVRLYAAELTGQADADALTRLFDYYLHAASTAMDALFPNESYPRQPIARPVTPAPEFADAEQARDWLDSERLNLVAAAAHAGALSTILFRYFSVAAHYQDALTLHTNALRATTPDAPEYGAMLYHRGSALIRLGRYAEAFEDCAQAVRYAVAHRDLTTEQLAVGGLAFIHEQRCEHDQALAHRQRALTVAERSGQRFGVVIALNNLGASYRRVGRHDEAIDLLERALTMADEVEDVNLRIGVLTSLGEVSAALGQHAEALARFQHVLDIARDTRNRSLEVEVLNDLGRTHLSASAPEQAGLLFEQALTFTRDIPFPLEQARAYHGLGLARRSREHLRRALDIYTALGDAAARDLATADLERVQEH
jgi:DNA-binding SARP family transcriptional activator/tetratricopeptide (TPR) repeat protein